jgi:hypothetical protein
MTKTEETFATASEALARLVEFESTPHDEFFQYEVSVVFNTDRAVIGYQVRVKDVDGFGRFSLKSAA